MGRRKRKHPDTKRRFIGMSDPEYVALLRLKADFEEEATEQIDLRTVVVAGILTACVYRGVPFPPAALDDQAPLIAEGIREDLRCQWESEGALSSEEGG